MKKTVYHFRIEGRRYNVPAYSESVARSEAEQIHAEYQELKEAHKNNPYYFNSEKDKGGRSGGHLPLL